MWWALYLEKRPQQEHVAGGTQRQRFTVWSDASGVEGIIAAVIFSHLARTRAYTSLRVPAEIAVQFLSSGDNHISVLEFLAVPLAIGDF